MHCGFQGRRCVLCARFIRSLTLPPPWSYAPLQYTHGEKNNRKLIEELKHMEGMVTEWRVDEVFGHGGEGYELYKKKEMILFRHTHIRIIRRKTDWWTETHRGNGNGIKSWLDSLWLMNVIRVCSVQKRANWLTTHTYKNNRNKNDWRAETHGGNSNGMNN